MLSDAAKRKAYDAELRAAESGMYAEAESWASRPQAQERATSFGGSASIFQVDFQGSCLTLVIASAAALSQGWPLLPAALCTPARGKMTGMRCILWLTRGAAIQLGVMVSACGLL